LDVMDKEQSAAYKKNTVGNCGGSTTCELQLHQHQI
jgi:hypothetical protein